MTTPELLPLRVSRSETALLQLLELLVGREGRRWWRGGTLAGFVAKMVAPPRYGAPPERHPAGVGCPGGPADRSGRCCQVNC